MHVAGVEEVMLTVAGGNYRHRASSSEDVGATERTNKVSKFGVAGDVTP